MFEHFWVNLMGGAIGVTVIFLLHQVRQFFREAAAARENREARTEALTADDPYEEFGHEYTLDISVPHWVWFLGQRWGFSGSHSTYSLREYEEEDADRDE